jgi:adenylate cyclase
MAIPVVMQENCVACHNTHPQSRKTDWKVGDVRGVQVFSVSQPISFDFASYRNLLVYFFALALTGGLFIRHQARQARTITESNRSLSKLNSFLEDLTSKLSVYLSPQIFKFIFSGDKNVSISTERKKLTIFFSDIQGFTETTDNMQPEDLSNLLNDYLTEMSDIALKHGATIDKYVGDAILVFFGDPETKGEAEDAKACIRMAVEMQQRLRELNVKWRRQGIAKPFVARMGVNTGYCNVGNFGSAKRMDYTIIGMEANLAARLEGISEPGSIAISTETYGLVRDIVEAEEGKPVALKGISRKITPYFVHGLVAEQEKAREVIAMNARGLDLYIDVGEAEDGELDELIAKVIRLRAERRAGLFKPRKEKAPPVSTLKPAEA